MNLFVHLKHLWLKTLVVPPSNTPPNSNHLPITTEGFEKDDMLFKHSIIFANHYHLVEKCHLFWNKYLYENIKDTKTSGKIDNTCIWKKLIIYHKLNQFENTHYVLSCILLLLDYKAICPTPNLYLQVLQMFFLNMLTGESMTLYFHCWSNLFFFHYHQQTPQVFRLLMSTVLKPVRHNPTNSLC